MTEIANADINTFGLSSKADSVLSSEQIISLTYGQLQELIRGAVEQAIQPLQDEIAQQGEEIASLRATVTSVESTQEQDITRVYCDIAYDRQRLAKLEHPTTTRVLTANQENRIKILRSLLAAHNGKMLTKEAREIMRMDKGAFSRLVAAMPEYVETKPYSCNKRQTVLILKSRSIVDDNDQRLK